MTIAIVYHYFAHYRLPILEELNKSSFFEIDYIAGDQSEIDIKLIDFSSTSLSFLKVNNHWLFKNKFLYQNHLISTLKKKQYDHVIFLGSPYHISTWVSSWILKKHTNTKIHYWLHGFWHDQLSLADKIKVKYFYPMADSLLLYGNWAKERLERLNFNNCTVIYNSLDYHKSLEHRRLVSPNIQNTFRHKWFNNTNPTIITIGRLTAVKKIGLLIDALKKCHMLEHEYNLLIVGNGGEYNKLLNQANQLGLINSIHFAGAIYDESKISELVGSSDICIIPGGMGLTSIHSLTYGTPIATHNEISKQMPEVEALIPQKNGFFFAENSIEDLSSSLIKWLDERPYKSESLQIECFKEVDQRYNPVSQRKFLERALRA